MKACFTHGSSALRVGLNSGESMVIETRELPAEPEVQVLPAKHFIQVQIIESIRCAPVEDWFNMPLHVCAMDEY
jgi:hypothetical protein